jgi:probable rRNA maturation factor
VTVTVANEQEAFAFDEADLLRDVTALADAAGWTGDLGVAVVTDARIHEVNREFLEHDYPTDVIAFPMDEGEGEIVVSAERALEEAKDRGVDPMAELLLYVVHGLLHLLGHDDHDPDAARRMHERSLNLLAGLGYANRIPPGEMSAKEES